MNYMNVGEKIRTLRKHKGMTQEELASLVGIDSSYLSRVENNQREVSLGILQKIAEALQVPISAFFEDSEVQPINLPKPIKTVPLFDTEVSAGNGSFPEAFQPIELIPVDRKDVDYAFRVRGRSMEPELQDGDIVLIKALPVNYVNDGEIVVAIYDGQFYVKRIHFVDGTVMLMSDNDEYAPIIVDPQERFEVIGKVVEVRRIPKRKKFRRG